MTLRKPLDVIENLLPHIGILIFDRSAEVLLLAVYHRVFPAHAVLAKKIASDPRTCWLSIATVPAGDAIPKMLATMKLPIRANSSVAPVAISRSKCFLSDFSSSGLPVWGLITSRQICCWGSPTQSKP